MLVTIKAIYFKYGAFSAKLYCFGIEKRRTHFHLDLSNERYLD